MMKTTKEKPEAVATKTAPGRPRIKPTPVSVPEAELRTLLGAPEGLTTPVVCKMATAKIKQLGG